MVVKEAGDKNTIIWFCRLSDSIDTGDSMTSGNIVYIPYVPFVHTFSYYG